MSHHQMTYDVPLRSLEPHLHHRSSQFSTNSHHAATHRASQYDLGSVEDGSMGSTIVCDDEELLYQGRKPTPRLPPSVAGDGTCSDDFRYYYIHTPCEDSKLFLKLDISGDVRRNRTDSEHCFKEEALIKSPLAAWGYTKKDNGDLAVVLTLPCSGGRSVRSEEAIRHNRCNLAIITRTYNGKVETDAVINSLDAKNLSILMMRSEVRWEQAKSVDPLNSKQKRVLALGLSEAETNRMIFTQFRDKRESSLAALETQVRKIMGTAMDISRKREHMATVWHNVALGSPSELSSDVDAETAVDGMWVGLADTSFHLDSHQIRLLPDYCKRVAASLKEFGNTPSEESFFAACAALDEAVSSMSGCVDHFNLAGLQNSERRIDKSLSICQESTLEAYTDLRETIDTIFQPLVKQVHEVHNMTKNLFKDTQDSLIRLESKGDTISRACPSW